MCTRIHILGVQWEREAGCFGTHLPASSIEIGLVPMSALVALTLGLDSALLDFDRCCMLVLDDSKAFQYTSFCLLTESSDFLSFVSLVKNHCWIHLQSYIIYSPLIKAEKPLLDTFAKLYYLLTCY